MKSRTMADMFQPKAKREDLMYALAILCINITIEESRVTTRLAKENLRDMSLPDWSQFLKRLKLFKRTY